MKKFFLIAMALALVAAVPAQAENVWVQKHHVDMEEASGGGWLGVAVGDTRTQRNDEPEQRELKIVNVYEGSPAEAAGFQNGDLLVSVNNSTVTSADQFVQAVRGLEAGDAVTVTILRDGREQTLTATLGERPEDLHGLMGHKKMVFKMGEDGEDFQVFDMGDINVDVQALHDALGNLGDAQIIMRKALECDDEQPCVAQMTLSHKPRLGVRIEALTDQLAGYFGVNGGVLVSEVLEGSAAEKAGLQAGDIITRVGSQEISNGMDLREVLADVELPGTVRLEVSRDGRTRFLDAQLEAPEVDAPAPFQMRFAPLHHDRGERLKL